MAQHWSRSPQDLNANPCEAGQSWPLDLNVAALGKLISQPVSAALVSYISNFAAGIMYCNPNIRVRDNSRRVIASNDAFPSLYDFISALIHAAGVSTPTLLSTLVYLTRLRQRLSAHARYGARCTAHRIFVSVVILTSKYLNDGRTCKKTWASCCNESAGSSSFFLCPVDITRLEIETLRLLDYNLAITEEDLYLVLEPFLRPIRQDIIYRFFEDQHSPHTTLQGEKSSDEILEN